MKSIIEVGDLVRATGGIEGPPESIGTGVVLKIADDDNVYGFNEGEWETVPKRWVVLFEKSRHPWKLYADDLEVIQKGG